jgi:hypothetical protein
MNFGNIDYSMLYNDGFGRGLGFIPNQYNMKAGMVGGSNKKTMNDVYKEKYKIDYIPDPDIDYNYETKYFNKEYTPVYKIGNKPDTLDKYIEKEEEKVDNDDEQYIEDNYNDKMENVFHYNLKKKQTYYQNTSTHNWVKADINKKNKEGWGMIGKGWEFEEIENEEGETNIKPKEFKVLEPIELITFNEDELLKIKENNEELLKAIKNDNILHSFTHGDIYDIEKNVKEENDNIKNILDLIKEQNKEQRKKLNNVDSDNENKIKKADEFREKKLKENIINFERLLKNFENLNENELLELRYLLDMLENDYISYDDANKLTDRIIDKEIKMMNLKSIRRKEMGSQYKEEVGFKKYLDDGEINTEITKGTNDIYVNSILDNFVNLIGKFGKRLENAVVKTINDNGGEAENNDDHPFYSKFKSKLTDDNGKLLPLSDFLPYDLNVKLDNGLWGINEIKNFIDPATQENLEREAIIQGYDGVYLQKAKIKPPRFIPFFTNDEKKNRTKLENIYDLYYNSESNNEEYKNKYVNNRPYYELKTIYLLPDGLYELDLMNFDLFPLLLSDIVEEKKIWDNKQKNIFQQEKKYI